MTSSSPIRSSSGKWFLFSIGLSVAILGALFVWLLGRSYLRAKDMRSWPEVECVILSSEIQQRAHDELSPLEYRHRVIYGYEWHGEPYTSERVSLRGRRWSSRQERAQSDLNEYPVGTTTTCHLRPGEPEFAVLEVDSLGPGYSIWFPGLFVVGGLGIAIRSLRPQS